MIITHCANDGCRVGAEPGRRAAARGVDVEIACDAMEPLPRQEQGQTHSRD